MWAELGGFSAFIVVLGIILKMQSGSISKKQDKAMCEQKNGEVKGNLIKGDEKFEKIDKKLDKFNKEQVEQGKVLIAVFTTVTRMEKNGK